MANDDQRKARELLAAEYDRDGIPFVADCIRTDAMLSRVEERAIRAIASALAQRAPQNGAMPEGMLDLVEALDAAMVESLMGEGADIWKGNRGKLRNRLPENVGAILAKMRALLAAAPAPETLRDWSERMAAVETGQHVSAGSHGIADDPAPEAERAKGETASGVIVDRDERGLIDKVYVVKGGRKELLATNPEHVIDARIVPPPVGQPDGVDDYERIYAEVIKVCADQPMAHEIASRLASAQRAGKDGA